MAKILVIKETILIFYFRVTCYLFSHLILSSKKG